MLNDIFKLDGAFPDTEFDNAIYLKIVGVEKENDFMFEALCLNKDYTTFNVRVKGRDFLDYFRDDKIRDATDTDKAKIVLRVKEF